MIGRRAPRALQWTLLFAFAHLLLTVVVFLLFGLGLEGPTIGGKILFVLGQPMLSVPWLYNLPAAVQNVLVPVNSLIWGLAVTKVLQLARRGGGETGT